MSKLYSEYLRRKSIDSEKYYLFKSGMFYIFLEADAINVAKKVPLKITNLNKEIVKCGFPEGSLEKYLNIFFDLGFKVEIVESINKNKNEDVVIKKIKGLNIDKISPIKALNILNEIKETLE